MANIGKKRLNHLYKRLKKLKKTFLGYPCTAKFDYSPIYRFLKFPINNVGDPFELSTFRLQTKEFEVEVLDFFARLFHIEDYWGYITSGGTEGNLYGIYLGREILPKAKVFFSKDTHYSIKKNVHLLGIKSTIVESQEDGEMNYKDLENKIKKEKEVIIVANIGTTMTGAIDDVEKITEILDKHKIKYYIHADAALYGMILPFVRSVNFDFRTKIDSIAISGHKFIGSPIPCGAVITRRKTKEKLKNYVEYIKIHDTTLSGSRDAFTPLILWYRIQSLGMSGFNKQVRYSLMAARYLVQELKKIGWPGIKQSYNTIRFKKPSDKIIRKWQLATNDGISHVISLPHITKKQIDQFIKEMAAEVRFLKKD